MMNDHNNKLITVLKTHHPDEKLALSITIMKIHHYDKDLLL